VGSRFLIYNMENKNNEPEKREAKRVQKNLIIQFSFDSKEGARKWDVSSIKDIGEKGVSFNAAGKFSLGSAVHMLIKIPLRPFEWFEVTGKLVAIEESKTSVVDTDYKTSLLRVYFLDLEAEQKTLIHEYVSWCLSKCGGVK